jgi:glycosyltransferase involved in cell wall biosynthesis
MLAAADGVRDGRDGHGSESGMSGLVSIIIPVYNRAAMLREAVASALAQTYRPLEVIVVDDGSTDDTARVADELSGAEVRVIHQGNSGTGAAREAGRRAARGEFVQHLDSDDLLLPRKLEVQVAALRARPECRAAYGWTRLRRRDGSAEPQPWKRSGERIEAMFPAMLQSRWWDTPTPLYRRSLIDTAGPWTTLRVEEDWEYDARVAALGVPLAYCEEWVCEVRTHDDHLSGKSDAATLRDRATAHALIYAHARHAGIADRAPEMQHFARELFLLARQCGAAGLADESRRLFELARQASGARAGRLQFRLYRALAGLLGWTGMGKLSRMADRLR